MTQPIQHQSRIYTLVETISFGFHEIGLCAALGIMNMSSEIESK